MRNTEFEDCEEFTPEVNMDVLKKCDRQLRRKRHLFANIVSIYQARIPVTHTLHLPTMIECDVTCKNMLGVHNSRFLAFLCSLDKRIFSLFLILKQWKKAHAFPMSTYNLTMLAIYYLQNLPQPILPSIESLKNACPTPVLENNWVCGFSTDPIEISNPIGLRALVVGFFRFLPTLDFGVDVICPLLGTTVERWKFKQPDTLPPVIRESLCVMPDLPLQTEKPMVVQDPFELNHNISKGMTHKNLVDLVSIASEVAELCEANPQLPLIGIFLNL